jgi:hypothetical protein
MNHNKRECKEAIGTSVHAHFPQVFIPPLYFSVATGFACFVTATEFKLKYILLRLRRLSYQQKECHVKTYGEARSKCPSQQKTYCASLVSANNISAP